MPASRRNTWLKRLLAVVLLQNHRLRLTRTGLHYVGVWLVLLFVGLSNQINLILLVAGLAAGPVVASLVISSGMVRGQTVRRRAPAYAFAGEPLVLRYSLENSRRVTAALAMIVEDDLKPVDPSVPGATQLFPQVAFARVPPRERVHLRWQSRAPARGKYEFGDIELVTRSPFGLMERRVTIAAERSLLVYPQVGVLSRRWQEIHREATEARRGRRHDRSTNQREYHGLRDYRPGDSPRWIHWRTTARIGIPMVKEFEQQSEQDLTILIDPWLPRQKLTDQHRVALEEAIKFAATLCLETCRHSGRRIVLGWTGPTPGVRQGSASIKLLHELLEQLAVMRPAIEGRVAELFDVLPASALRDSLFVLVSTRAINLQEELEHSRRMAGARGRGLAGRVLFLDAAKGDLKDLIRFEEQRASHVLSRGDRSASAESTYDLDASGSRSGESSPRRSIRSANLSARSGHGGDA